MKILIITFILITNLFSQDDLSSLLSSYEDQSALHNKTKDESAGHLVIFSRKDLNKMQAHSLKDVLKSIKYFTLQENERGALGLQRAGASCVNAGCVRLYINDQEMSSAITGSALLALGEYDLGHIDHIEIYLGGNAIKFGYEYSFVTIKLYTKEAKRDKGSFVGLSYSSHDSYSAQAFTSGTNKNDLDYMLYAKKTDLQKGNIQNQGFSVPRYSQSVNIFASLKKEDDFSVEISSYQNDHDVLAGFGVQKTPTTSDRYAAYQFVSATKYFGGLKVQGSYAQEKTDVSLVDTNGIKLYDGSTVQTYNVAFKNNIAKLSIEHDFVLGDNSFLYGVSYQDKDISYKSGALVGINGLNIESAFLEYAYAINKNNLLVATGKLEKYKHVGYSREDLVKQMRVGFVSLLHESITLKGFYADNYIYPAVKELVTFDKPIKGDPDLKPMDVHNYTLELIYKNDAHSLNLMYMKMLISDPIQVTVVGGETVFYNKPNVNAVFNDSSIEYEYRMNSENKLMLSYYVSNHNRPSDASPTSGGHIKLFNSFREFDFYNELIYRKGYISIPSNSMIIESGYDFTSAITMNVNKKLSIALKGENLLNKAIASPIKGLYPVPAINKRVSLFAEWSF